ncbi:MAG: glycosyltransferase [Proteobacteria bacterium]|nr:glycosyltransferase [Pseudomonadota bacterium]
MPESNVPRRILHSVPFFAPHFGGVADRCYQLTKVLAGQGHDITILTTDYQLSLPYAASLDPVKVVPVRSHGGRFRYCPAVKPWLEENIGCFDICHLMNHYSYINLAVADACRRRRIPYLFSAMGSMPVMHRSFLKKRLFNRLVGYRLILGATGLVAITRQEARQYLDYHPGIDPARVFVLPNAIDDTYDESVDPGAFYRRLGIPERFRLVLYVGRLDHIKGPDLLVQAFARVAQDFPEAALALVGPDFGARETVRRLIKTNGLGDRVFLCGPLYGGEKLEAYAAADILAVPSRRENMSIVALEAAVWKVPVVISETAGFPEVADSGAGRVVRPEIDDIARALLDLLLDEPGRRGMAENARRMVLDNYLWEKIGKRFDGLMGDLLDERTPVA